MSATSVLDDKEYIFLFFASFNAHCFTLANELMAKYLLFNPRNRNYEIILCSCDATLEKHEKLFHGTWCTNTMPWLTLQQEDQATRASMYINAHPNPIWPVSEEEQTLFRDYDDNYPLKPPVTRRQPDPFVFDPNYHIHDDGFDPTVSCP